MSVHTVTVLGLDWDGLVMTGMSSASMSGYAIEAGAKVCILVLKIWPHRPVNIHPLRRVVPLTCPGVARKQVCMRCRKTALVII